MITRPMLADKANIDKLKFPLLASPKYDGIRAIKEDGKLLSRKFKPIPNDHTRILLEKHLPDGVDGELIVLNGSFNDCQSAFMSIDGSPNFEYHLFDYVNVSLSIPFIKRLAALKSMYSDLSEVIKPYIKLVEQKLISNMEELIEYEAKCVSMGYEGVMVRTLDAPYKCGRSTIKEGFLLKIKRWEDSEGRIISLEEQMRNENDAEIDELGLMKRSSSKSGMIPANTLGKFIIEDCHTGIILGVGTGEGLTKELRQDIWNHRDEYIGKIITYKFQPSGVKTAPRFPIWKGFRSEDDFTK